MAAALEFQRSMTVTEATGRGVAGLLRDAEQGETSVVTRHGKPVAAVVSMSQLRLLSELESELREALLVLTRMATDNGRRVALDEAITAFGFTRDELEAELDADLAAGRE